MLESVLADVLTRVLGQYLEGIDRESVTFGAWSGLVELRGVALRPEALAVLFETLGLNLPVTVEAGFIGLLRLNVPWNAIGTTPVLITLEDITIIARPVRGDGSDDSELELRERRIKRARLNTDDAVREASWGVSSETESKASSSWSTWLVSDELRAKVIDNIQVHLKDIIIRFEDPFSDKQRPYLTSVVCESLKIVSANEAWHEAFVERGDDMHTRKLMEVSGFRVDWAPITTRDQPGASLSTDDHTYASSRRFHTPELLRQFVRGEASASSSPSVSAHASSLIDPIDGFMRILLSPNNKPAISSADLHQLDPAVDLDIRFPNVTCNLNDVQYTSLLQTSVYFARLATRGVRPKTAKARWVWAIDQLLPGFSDRRKRALRFTEAGMAETKTKRLVYTAYRKSLLKARRTGVEEPKEISEELENIESCTSYEEIIAFRDWIDRQIDADHEEWQTIAKKEEKPESTEEGGTTTSTFWRMLGYVDEQEPQPQSSDVSISVKEDDTQKQVSLPKDENDKISKNVNPQSEQRITLALRVAFLLQSVTLNLSQGGFPRESIARLSCTLQNLRAGVLLSSANDLITEAVLGSVQVWDILKNRPLAYNRFSLPETADDKHSDSVQSAYPTDVSDALESIRDGSNPASEVLMYDEAYSDQESDTSAAENQFDSQRSPSLASTTTHSASSGRRRKRSKAYGSRARDATPPTFRVTEEEFLGTSRSPSSLCRYAAAFRYRKQVKQEGVEETSAPRTYLDVSIATLEAVVDGPKGSFVWGLKFWRPRGMAQDPIMAFLGAAAGARIAELRMEIEEALIANKVPLQINAVILAPRFIIPGSKVSSPAIVVNLGTIGVCTSDNVPVFGSGESQDYGRMVRYSNYVMTLDNLGMYYCPSLGTALSMAPEMGLLPGSQPHTVDTTAVERIIRPFSLRFMVQTLRDANIVQVARHSSTDWTSSEDNLAKVRVRGTIPDVSLILTQAAFQHLLITVDKWSRELLPTTTEKEGNLYETSVQNWPVSRGSEERTSPTSSAVSSHRHFPEGQKHEKLDKEPLPTALASYDIRLLLNRVSIELRDRAEMRLLTLTAYHIQGKVVKTGRTSLRACFSLQSWSITDGSRGSTAAYRRLVYAGNLSSSKGVSPPRSTSGTADSRGQETEEDQDFVTIRYDLDFRTRHQRIRVHFLSLHVICVRETYIRLARYFRGVREYVKANRVKRRNLHHNDQGLVHSSEDNFHLHDSRIHEQHGLQREPPALHHTYVVSEFDGLNFQLIASGGVVAVLEMRESKIQYLDEGGSTATAWGEFRYFSVRDLTSPVREHISVVSYEKPVPAIQRMLEADRVSQENWNKNQDEWVLSIPRSKGSKYELNGNFRGIKITLLYRFCDVLSQYFKILWKEVEPIVELVIETGDVTNNHAAIAQELKRDQLSNFIVHLVLRDLTLRLPRHSACASEALNIGIQDISLTNSGQDGDSKKWSCRLTDAQFAIEYLLIHGDPSGPISVSSSFLTNFMADIVVGVSNDDGDGGHQVPLLTRREVWFKSNRNVFLSLSEAQYTILYFVLTENLAETVTELDLSLGMDCLKEEAGHEFVQVETQSTETKHAIEHISASDIKNADVIPQLENTQDMSVETFVAYASFPSLALEISRGWDVTQESCKVLGLSLKNIRMLIKLFSPRRLIVELDAKLQALEDLRPESPRLSSEFAVPLAITEDTKLSFDPVQNDTQQNFSMVYDKEGRDRPSIFLGLNSLQLDIPLDLFRDLSHLAVPGWPFLESSAFPPDFVYLGRTLNVVMRDSQLLLRTYQHDRDRRALALIGEFEVKMEWMRRTGAKVVSLEARQMEISCVHEIRPLGEEYDVFGVKSFFAYPLEASTTPLLYPSNLFVEYVGPLADEKGCRLRLSSEALLCLVNASDIPILRATSAEISQKRPSYLSRRAWKQAAYAPGKGSTPVEPKEQQRRIALKSINVSMDIAAVRCLLSDDTNGQFVPVLETQISSLLFSSHAGNMTQIEGVASMDLFNAEKGWWEPALEPWNLAASISHGQSGARSYIIRSDKRADFNITPTTITAVLTVLRTLSMPGRATSASGEHEVQKLFVRESDSNKRPAVAAFFVRNELGLPVNVNLPSTSHRITILHGSEIEVQAQSESLVSSGTERSRKSRESALRCSLTIPSYFSKNVSASEVGIFPLAFFPTESSGAQEETRKLFVVWEVKMSKGVPVCTLRSQYRVLNRTKCPMQVFVSTATKKRPEATDASERSRFLDPGESFSVPVQYTKNEISIRPVSRTLEDVSSAFEWSSPIPSLKWLRRVARDTGRNQQIRSAGGKRRPHMRSQFVVCKALEKGSCDFFMKLEPKCSVSYDSNRSTLQGWIDVALMAPIVLRNHLPRSLFYKVTLSETMPNAYAGSSYDYGETILAAGKVNSLEVEHLHFSGDSLTPGFLSLAYDNLPSAEKPDKSWLPEFGKSVSLLDVENGRVKAIFTAPENNMAVARRAKELRCFVSSDESVSGAFTVSAGVWVRNRSDTPFEVCSRNSFYGTASNSIILRSRPPFEEPDEHVCLEGPYLSLRLLNGSNETSIPDELDQQKWWTTPSSLLEAKKPILVNLPGRSLVLEIGTAEGVKENTRLVTIRNESWILNCTSTPLQWCQTSALDAHGNCPTRYTRILEPGSANAVHWETKFSSFKAVHLRVTEEHGHSDWIWSPAVPLNIGFSRELPAKMYRPKTHEQYIARVDSKKIGRGSRALVIFPEDRENPPYRIVNLCKERAVAFSQLGSQERPWLVRGGKSTRYSWDDPLAPPDMRRLSIRILEKQDLRNARSGSTPVHDFVVLSIDVVGERVMVLSEGYEPTVNVDVAVEGATKIVTFSDDGTENDSMSKEVPQYKRRSRLSSGEGSAELVPVVGWDEIGRSAGQVASPVGRQLNTSIAALCDYPLKEKKAAEKVYVQSNGHVNAAIFLNSIGISLIDAEPAELVYIWAKGILINLESSNVSQSGSVHIQGFQVDNQLHQTPYPVLLSVTNPQTDVAQASSGEAYAESGAIAVAFQRALTNDDIIMIKSFQAAVNPFHLSVEDKLVSGLIRFLADTSIVGKQSFMDISGKLDEDLRIFQSILPQLSGFNEIPRSGRQAGGLPSSKRIYVHDFKVNSSVLRLTSVGSGAAVAKAAGVGLTASTILGLVLNVENCEFQLAALEVQNVFDSLHHFSALVREYYISQLSNQRMKLLASNALMGNPAALFDAVGTGAKDFLNESGKAKGSAEFIASVGRGSKSLLSHTVGGIMESVSSIPRAVSSGLEKAVGDNAYLAERQRIRAGSGQRNQVSKNPAQGFATGALSFAHGISSGVTGFIREPVQGARQGGAGGLLKGIGKAFIGGVAKPVAGAIDLVAEPAAGLSRQIAEDRTWKPAVAERPPRAFQGQSRRLDVYDRRYAIGVCLFKAVQSYNNLPVDTDLIDWVELSERDGRSGNDSDLWAWSVIRQFARSMPGSKKRLEGSQRPSRAGSSLETRVEKTRAALITESDVIIATLDCKLVAWITLWADAKYDVWSDGKDVVLSGEIVENGGGEDLRSGMGAGSIVNAPWDVPNVERKRRPRVGERFEERIACGSSSASDDVRQCIAKVVQRLQEEREGKQEMWSGIDSASRSQELLALSSGVDDNNGIELRSGRKTSSGASELGRLGRPAGGGWGTRDQRKQKRRGSASLERTVRKLVGTSSRRGMKQGGLRFVIANRLEDNMVLVVREGRLDGSTWGGELAKEIEGFDAQIVETERAEEGVEVTGCVVYDILNAQRKRIGEIAVELFCGRDGAASFTTKASHGFHVDFEKEGKHGAFVFYVRETVGEIVSSRSGGGDRVGSAANDNAEAVSDEQMVQQLVDIGFGLEDAVVALAEAEGDMVKAVDFLTK